MAKALLLLVIAATSVSAMTPLYEASPNEAEAPARSEIVIVNTAGAWSRKPDRLWLELWCNDTGEATVVVCVKGGKGGKGNKRGEYRYLCDLPEKGRRSVSIPYTYVCGAVDVAAVSNVTVRTEDGVARWFGVARMALLAEGEEPPPIAEAPRIHAKDSAAHHEAYQRFRSECRRGVFVIGQATSMENVRPRADFAWSKAEAVCVRLSKGEYESVQILVAPALRDLKNVRVSVDMGETRFSATNITASVVGYVETTHPAPYWIRPKKERPARGWWPDPILDFQREADISGEDVQSFWVRVHCPEWQTPGIYGGSLMVSADGEESVSIPFRIRVNGFAVGKVSPLPIAVSSIYPGAGTTALDGRADVAKRIRENEYHRAWETREEQYCDFFADYYITLDSLYVNSKREPRWDMLMRLKRQGRLGLFNLCYWWYMGLKPDSEAKWRDSSLKIFRERYERAKALGIEKHAYLYGCDELGESVFTNIARTVEALHREFPDVPLMTTARDLKLGLDGSLLKDIDIHCPALCFWENRPVRAAQRNGRQVWWYFCNNPASPWANTTLEGPPMEIRSLMGAQTQKFKPDGFLYYATLNWNSEKPIAKGPFTEWNPRSFEFYHGDGQWTCCGGSDMLPLATIRLENFRDGLEDLWYVRELEKRLASRKDKNDGWARAARTLLEVPDELVRSVKDFSVDPAVLYRWRDAMADLIELSRQ